MRKLKTLLKRTNPKFKLYITIIGSTIFVLLSALLVFINNFYSSINPKPNTLADVGRENSRPLPKLALQNIVQTIQNTELWATPPTVEVNVINTIPINTSGTIIQGPLYAANTWWWKIEFNQNLKGWVQEDLLKKTGGNSIEAKLPADVRTANIDTVAPKITQLNIANNSTVTQSQIELTGLVTDNVSSPSQISFLINGNKINLANDGTFKTNLNLTPGTNTFTFTTQGPTNNPRQQINNITSYLDGSAIYGSDKTRSDILRTLSQGKLKTSTGNLLPKNTFGLLNSNDAHIFPEEQLFLGGDIRANDNSELMSIHTLMVREHNLIANMIREQHPELNDEQIYQWARSIVIAETQAITYNEYLPTLLGPNAISQYQGYNKNINPSIANEFSTVAYRFGHFIINDLILLLDNDSNQIAPPLELSKDFFNPTPIEQFGPEPFLKYLSTDQSLEAEPRMVDVLRNFLFGPPGAGGFDLYSLDIQRARDHGIASYNTTRKAYGLAPVTDFNQISSNPTIQNQLSSLYNNVNDVDLFIGGIAEDHLPGNSLGPTYTKIITEQFERTRDGDRFWYQNTFSGQALSLLHQTNISDLIRRNTNINKLQENVFFFDRNGIGNKNSNFFQDQSVSINKLRNIIAATNPTTNTYSLDGHGNNQMHPTWGENGTNYLRMAPAAYTDGISSPLDSNLPNPRTISNTFGSRISTHENSRNTSDWIYAWGQFIAHEIDLTDPGLTPFNIPVPAGDPSFDPNSTGNKVIRLNRSNFDASTGTGTTNTSTESYTLILNSEDISGTPTTSNTPTITLTQTPSPTSTPTPTPTTVPPSIIEPSFYCLGTCPEDDITPTNIPDLPSSTPSLVTPTPYTTLTITINPTTPQTTIDPTNQPTPPQNTPPTNNPIEFLQQLLQFIIMLIQFLFRIITP